MHLLIADWEVADLNVPDYERAQTNCENIEFRLTYFLQDEQ